jgi:hypothetical protein
MNNGESHVTETYLSFEVKGTQDEGLLSQQIYKTLYKTPFA